jgi:hypothetical protein
MAYAKVVSFLRLIMSDIWWSINMGAKENEGKWTRHRFTYAVVFFKKKKMKLLKFQVSSKEEMGLFTVVSGLYNASEIAIHYSSDITSPKGKARKSI